MNENILVTARMTLGQKNRISLIKSTGAVEGDKLVLILRQDYIEVKELSKIIEELRRLKECIYNASTVEMVTFYQERLDYVTACIGNVVEVDNNGRIIINPGIVERYNLTNEVVIEGILDGFRIWEPNKFDKYQADKINKFRIK